MLEAARAFIVRTTDWRSPALSIFRRRLAVVSLMASCSGLRGFGLGWKRASALRAISMIVLRSSSLNLSAVSNRARTSAGMSAAASRTACSASVIWSSGTAVEEFRGQRQQHGDLRGHGHRGEFRLLEAGADSPSVLDDLAGVFIQAGAEPGKGLEFLELRVGELEVARHRAVGRALRLAADARNGFADIDRRQHAQFEQRRREVDLPVRDGNQVGRNVGGNVLRFGFDDGQRGERAAAEFLAQVRGAFEQARVDVEDVAGKGFASGRTAEQEGKLAIGAGVLREVVVNDQHVAARFHEMLRDAGRGVGRDVGEARRVVAFGDDDDGVIHRALFAQVGHGLGDGGSALADGAIDAQHILAALVQDGVDRDGGLARLAVAQNQFALAAPDGNERIDDLEAGLERHGDRRAVHDGRRRGVRWAGARWRPPARCHRAAGRAGR